MLTRLLSCGNTTHITRSEVGKPLSRFDQGLADMGVVCISDTEVLTDREETDGNETPNKEKTFVEHLKTETLLEINEHSTATSKEVNSDRRTKGLRKRRRTRGHGTLNMMDMEHVKTVNIHDIDMRNTSIQKEFGMFGALPAGTKRLWSRKLTVKPSKCNKTQFFKFKLAPGLYRYVVSMKPRRINLFGEMVVYCKAWLINQQYGFSKEYYSGYVSSKESRFNFDLTVLPEDCKTYPLELRVEFFSNSRFFNIPVNAQLHKVVEEPLANNSSSSSFDAIVLEGDDQSKMILKTHAIRAKERKKNAKQKLRKNDLAK